MDAPVAILPAAAAPDNNHERAGRNGVRWFHSLGASHVDLVPVIDKASANDPLLAGRVRSKRLIYLLGGFPRHLAESLRQSLVWQAALQAYADGAVIGGSSAGAMVLCEHYYDRQAVELLPGLNLLPACCILPHHNTFGGHGSAEIAQQLPASILIGLDEQTGILNDSSGTWRSYGAGQVTLYRNGLPLAQPPSATFRLDESEAHDCECRFRASSLRGFSGFSSRAARKIQCSRTIQYCTMKRIAGTVLLIGLTACATRTTASATPTTARATPTATSDMTTPSSIQTALPDLGPAPELTNSVWLNTDSPLRLAALRGKVVGLDMWTFDCINCQHVIPTLRRWYAAYKDKGLVIIGNHFPEFPNERDLGNLKQAVAQDGITYPVAQDNDGATWWSYSSQYWPTLYLIDKRGHLRYIHVGEGAYDETEANIKTLLAEAYP